MRGGVTSTPTLAQWEALLVERAEFDLLILLVPMA
jgi:hypothetical protein